MDDRNGADEANMKAEVVGYIDKTKFERFDELVEDAKSEQGEYGEPYARTVHSILTEGRDLGLTFEESHKRAENLGLKVSPQLVTKIQAVVSEGHDLEKLLPKDVQEMTEKMEAELKSYGEPLLAKVRGTFSDEDVDVGDQLADEADEALNALIDEILEGSMKDETKSNAITKLKAMHNFMVGKVETASADGSADKSKGQNKEGDDMSAQEEKKAEEKAKKERSEVGKSIDDIYKGLGGFKKTGVVTAKYGGATLAAPCHAVKHTVLLAWDILKAGGNRVVRTCEDTAATARGVDALLTLHFSDEEEKKEDFLKKAAADPEKAHAECGLSMDAIKELAKARNATIETKTAPASA
jgi:hypothetical protein